MKTSSKDEDERRLQDVFINTYVCWGCSGEFSDGKGAFYNGNESDNSDNDDENYNENNEQ